MNELSLHIAFIVFELCLRSICVDYDIAIYQPCDVVPCPTQRRGDISMIAVFDKNGDVVILTNAAVRIYFHFT